MIRKYYEAICDNCNCAIGHYVFSPVRNAKDDGAIIKKGKHFCNEKCWNEYNNVFNLEEEE